MDLSDLPFSWLLFLFLFFLPACGKKTLKEYENSFNSEQYVYQTTEDDLLKLAKYADIPVPVGFAPVSFDSRRKKEFEEKRTELLCFSGDLSYKETINFYRNSFEREGWEIRDLSNEYEGLLWATKINKSCVVSVRGEQEKMTYVYVFIQKSMLARRDVSVKEINSKNITL
jgi:hypothetical protein